MRVFPTAPHIVFRRKKYYRFCQRLCGVGLNMYLVYRHLVSVRKNSSEWEVLFKGIFNMWDLTFCFFYPAYLNGSLYVEI
jgi:hypothetical protein